MTTVVRLGKEKYSLQLDMERWCIDNIGKNPPYKNWVYSEPKTWDGLGNWCMASMFGNTFFFFKDENHAIIFEKVWK